MLPICGLGLVDPEASTLYHVDSLTVMLLASPATPLFNLILSLLHYLRATLLSS